MEAPSATDPAAQIMERAKRHLLGNYKQAPFVLERGEGAYVWDTSGKRYLDLLAGIATCSLGHCHPEVVAAVKAQADKLWHVSNVFYTQPSVDLAAQLTEASGLDRAFFCNSGAEANEALIKLARKVMHDRGTPGRHAIIAFDNSFHGRTLTTVSATGQPKYQKGFEPLTPGFVHVPFGDFEAVTRAVREDTAAVLVEPIQGEGGVRVAPPGFLKALRALCDEKGILLLVDEVQTGMGRTGAAFAYQHELPDAASRPDAISLAKALGNGIPIGAMLCREEHAKSLGPGTHGSTFGGNLLAAAAANVVTRIVCAPPMLQQVRELGQHFTQKAEALAARMPDQVKSVRGRGLLLGLELASEAAPVIARCREAGLLCNAAGEKVLRFAPPFVVTKEQIDEALGLVEKALAS